MMGSGGRKSGWVSVWAVLVSGSLPLTSAVYAGQVSFEMDDNFTGGAEATVEVTLDDEASPGDVQITVEVIEPEADIRGVFFHVEQESLLGGLEILGVDVTNVEIGANSILDAGNGANLNGAPNLGFDIGVQIGSPGIGTDDIAATVFSVSHDTESLSIDHVIDGLFGARLTSVGTAPDRSGSTKLRGVAPEPTSLGVWLSTAILAGVRPRRRRREG